MMIPSLIFQTSGSPRCTEDQWHLHFQYQIEIAKASWIADKSTQLQEANNCQILSHTGMRDLWLCSLNCIAKLDFTSHIYVYVYVVTYMWHTIYIYFIIYIHIYIDGYTYYVSSGTVENTDKYIEFLFLNYLISFISFHHFIQYVFLFL